MKAEIAKRIKLVDILCGGSGKGSIDISYQELVELIGEPNSDTDGYKVDAEWSFAFDGEGFAIYNYKDGVNYLGREGTPVEFITDWHIGGNNKEKAEELKTFLLQHRSGPSPISEVTNEELDILFEMIRLMDRINFTKVKDLVDNLV